MNIGYASLGQMKVWAWAIMRRDPDFIIGDPAYLKRWWIVPRNEFGNVYLHEIHRSDDDRALHDHPWDNTSYIIKGGYVELTPNGSFDRNEGDVIHRKATDRHGLILADNDPCVSLFFTGPKVREWGFWCENERFVHWRDFTAGENGEIVGRGCGD